MSKQIYLRLESIEPDPQQFKPYKPQLRAENVFVMYTVPDDYILGEGMNVDDLPRGAIVVTPKCVARLAQLTNLAIRSVLENATLD
jgi:hypothetical protein